MKTLVKSCVVVAVLLMLSYMTMKFVRIEEKFAQLSRPARLFNPSQIQSKLPHRAEWDVKISPNHDKFFYVLSQQQLNWLGRGMQVIVFETQDGKYVVKFVQLGRMKENTDRGFFQNLLSKETKEKREERLQHREEIFSSSKMAFEELQDETGIIYIHLNRTENKLRGIKLVDRNGQSHRIRGDDASFLVQKKAAYVIPTLTQLMEKGDLSGAKQRINHIIEMLLSLSRKGFVDGDDALIRNNNMGFTDDRAIYIDTGHMFKVANLNVMERMKYEFNVRLDPLEKWLNIMYPILGEHYREQRDTLIASLIQEKEAVASLEKENA